MIMDNTFKKLRAFFRISLTAILSGFLDLYAEVKYCVDWWDYVEKAQKDYRGMLQIGR